MESQSSPQSSSKFATLVDFVARHPAGVVQGVIVFLVVVVVLQNLEPTSLDVLFWSVSSLPKLVVILLAMLAGGFVWEVLRRRLFP